MSNLKNSKGSFVLFLIVFYLTWTLREIYLPWEAQAPILAALLSISIWTGAPIIYLATIDKVNPLSFLKLNTNPGQGLKWGIVISIGYFILTVIYSQLIGNAIDFSLEWQTWLNVVILVGLVEEIMFRGFIFHKLQEYMTIAQANIFQAILFVLIHVPVWIARPEIYHPTGTLGAYLFSVCFIFIFGLGMGFLVNKTNSLWGAILVHSMVDFTNSVTLGEY